MPSKPNKGKNISPEVQQPKKKRKKAKSTENTEKLSDTVCTGATTDAMTTPSSTQPQATTHVMASTQGLCSPTGASFYPFQPPPQYPPQTFQTPSWIQDLVGSIDQIKQDQHIIKIKLDKLDQIDAKMASLERNVKSIDNRVATVEKSTQFLSDCHDEDRKTMKDTKETVAAMKAEIDQIQLLRRDNGELRESIIDLQARSMRDNLLFFGLPEENEENCARTVTAFCKDKLDIAEADDIKFDRAHRLGAKRQGNGVRPRPIVVKLNSYTDKETIKSKGPLLRGTNFGVRDQYPREIVSRRNELYPIMRRERERGKNCRLVRDKLYIDGVEFRQQHSATY
jgi:hypothetical protein